MVKFGMEFTALALPICIGTVIVVLTVLKVKFGQLISMLAVVPEVNIGMDSTVSPVQVEDHGIQVSIVVLVPSDSIGMELSV